MPQTASVAPLPALLQLSLDERAFAACEAALIVDARQTIVAANAAAELLLRHPVGTLKDRALAVLLPERSRAAHAAQVRRFAGAGPGERRMADRRAVTGLRGDGSECEIEVYLWRLDLAPGGAALPLCLALLRDASIAPLLRRQVAEMNQRFVDVMDMAPVAMWVVENDRVVFANRAAHALFDAPDGRRIVGAAVRDLVSADAWQALRGQMERALAGGDGGPPVPGRITRADGSTREVEIGSAPLPDHGRTVVQMVISDITAHRQQAQAQAAHRAELRQLSANVVEAREEERRRIARELHDELGQRLSGLKMALSTLGPVGQGPGGRPEIDALLAMIDDTVASVRRISTDLRPLILDDLGLNAAIESLARDAARRLGLEVTVRLGDQDPPVDDRVGIAIYRMVQEALTNVGRHAHATDVRIELQVQGAELVLRVRDNGVGFPDRSQQHDGRFGLLGIRERAYMLGGRFEVDNPPGGGGRLTVRLPLLAQDPPAAGRRTAR